jgi:site-specific DNA recombinase
MDGMGPNHSLKRGAKMRVALYARVSSQEQVEGFSLDAQLKAMREFALHKEWDIAGEYTDAGFSARSDVRPEFKRLIADAIDAGGSVL